MRSVLLPAAAWCAAAGAWAADSPKTNSRAPFVHRINLYDEEGEVISPDEAPMPPYSPKATCGKCHPYDTIRRGWHFRPDAKTAGRPGEPWFLLDAKGKTATLVSGRGWPGTVRPEEARLTRWKFALRFGAYWPGGLGEEAGKKPVDPAARWAACGALEIDCLACHSASPRYDMAERARQIARWNFRWAPTAAAGWAVVRGEAKDLPKDYDPEFPDMTAGNAKPPQTLYDKSLFDADDRVLVVMRAKPTDERCLFCHSTRVVGDSEWRRGSDAHSRAGLKCVDCHRNGIDHQIERGAAGDFSCRGCHYRSRRFGAPKPRHAGLPSVHLRALACTTCHSGPRLGKSLHRFQTARAHGLGLPSNHRTDADPPRIVGPVFARDSDGKIRPHYAAWGRGSPPRGYLWPMAHDVRPAALALGAGGCGDCHSSDSAFFFAEVKPAEEAEGRPMWRRLGVSRSWLRVSAWAARLHGAFVFAVLLCLGLLAAGLTHYAVRGLARLGGRRP